MDLETVVQDEVSQKEENKKISWMGLAGDPVAKNMPCNAGDADSIPGGGTRLSHASEQLSPCITTTQPVCSGVHVPQLESVPGLQ